MEDKRYPKFVHMERRHTRMIRRAIRDPTLGIYGYLDVSFFLSPKPPPTFFFSQDAEGEGSILEHIKRNGMQERVCEFLSDKRTGELERLRRFTVIMMLHLLMIQPDEVPVTMEWELDLAERMRLQPCIGVLAASILGRREASLTELDAICLFYASYPAFLHLTNEHPILLEQVAGHVRDLVKEMSILNEMAIVQLTQ